LAGAASAFGTASAQPYLAGVTPRVPMTLDLTPVASNQLSNAFLSQMPRNTLNGSLVSSLSRQNSSVSERERESGLFKLVSSLSRQNSSVSERERESGLFKCQVSQTSILSRQQTLTATPVAFGGGALGQAGPLLVDKAPSVMADVAWPLKPNPQRLTSALPAHAGGALSLPADMHLGNSLGALGNSPAALGQSYGQAGTGVTTEALLQTLVAMSGR
jgi:hypothetical protein